MLFTRDDPTGLSGKKSSCLWRRCLRISPRAGGSAAFAPMGALTRGGLSLLFGNHFVRCGVTICFDPDTTVLLCQPEGSEETMQLPAQGLTKAELMGELAVLQALPIYQLALPFSLEAWRQLEYTHILTGTTL